MRVVARAAVRQVRRQRRVLGHDHIYERIKPQKGITYFVNGSSGELRKGDVRPSAMTAAYFDQDQAFSLVEIAGDDMFFQARSRTGERSTPA